MAGPRFDDPVYGSNVVTGISATGNAHQTFNFNQRLESRPFCLFPYEKNEDFIARPGITSKLEELLPKSSDEYRSSALWGLGGSGKTQIALDFAYSRYGKRQCSVFWVHADSETSFARDYGSIAKVLGIISQDSGHELLQNVRHRIESLPRWLLVLDNADDLSLLGVGSPASKPGNLMDYIPKGPNGTTLWISRDGAIVGSLVGVRRGIPASKMTFEESKALLESKLPQNMGHDELSNVRSLVKELQYLPLAISQAGTYMRRTETSVSQYLTNMREEQTRWRMLTEHQFDRYRLQGSPNSVREIWNTSIRQIRQENETAFKVLRILAYVDNENISERLIEAAAQHGEGKQTTEMSETKKREAIRRLKDFSFLIEHHDADAKRTFEMHKLVQDAVRYGLQVEEITKGNERKTNTESRLRTCFKRRFKTSGKDGPRTGEDYFASAAADNVAGLYPHETGLKARKAL
ncbi:hypothetical protein FBEOM_6060 [Fusarium beomiforme]|uniref:DUF7779 domain-containing protein n=1 Tax=Fusarium beomiforme TaxID=44412 RepID=A0A9P5AJZ4_9HYPO|nr:hypothetical protein FBEOM_6060 [Fusarium beomiforme]